ncbi:hypothetical protein Halha_1213 [Halobacteroides halobius DSM 5150]|uniref:Putative amidase domain-containing protein n=1 Tax=Halobacteroides halobius (strain ATCC 35273 / DSM 5150 / MD-1) TaxID=748449 RepID=L0K9D9_HALHC|nr:amidase domain-containing protein [Halobacteroides halobius]AGB41160.1 hypothetical protein Halha_1213 [Halobacteroides halobius DSM 5150]
MIILIKLKRRLLILLSVVFLLSCAIGVGLYIKSSKDPTVAVTNNTQDIVTNKINRIFKIRTKALLENNKKRLANLYNRKTKTGIWAYEHELKRMNYLHQWATKQGVKFKAIKPQIVIKRIKKKNEDITVNLTVSTEYKYAYQNAPQQVNSFRTGTYHSLDLENYKKELSITKEWYRDPLASSLSLTKIEKIRQLILAKKPKDLSTLNQRRVKAIKYVDQYCGAASPPKYGFNYNSKYKNYNYQGGDCANFASQMLYEGAGFRKNRIWNYRQGKGTRAWLNAKAFNSYMLNSGRASLIARGSYSKVLKTSYKLLPGDYIAYEKKGEVAHISVVSGIDSKGYILVNSHNADRHRVPWDLGWSNKGVKFWLVHVNY